MRVGLLSHVHGPDRPIGAVHRDLVELFVATLRERLGLPCPASRYARD
jgi:hypothetical protein